jgi:hypothetical protein
MAMTKEIGALLMLLKDNKDQEKEKLVMNLIVRLVSPSTTNEILNESEVTKLIPAIKFAITNKKLQETIHSRTVNVPNVLNAPPNQDEFILTLDNVIDTLKMTLAQNSSSFPYFQSNIDKIIKYLGKLFDVLEDEAETSKHFWLDQLLLTESESESESLRKHLDCDCGGDSDSEGIVKHHSDCGCDSDYGDYYYDENEAMYDKILEVQTEFFGMIDKIIESQSKLDNKYTLYSEWYNFIKFVNSNDGKTPIPTLNELVGIMMMMYSTVKMVFPDFLSDKYINNVSTNSRCVSSSVYTYLSNHKIHNILKTLPYHTWVNMDHYISWAIIASNTPMVEYCISRGQNPIKKDIRQLGQSQLTYLQNTSELTRKWLFLHSEYDSRVNQLQREYNIANGITMIENPKEADDTKSKKKSHRRKRHHHH